MPAVSDLDRARRTLRGAFGIGACAVAADHFHARVLALAAWTILLTNIPPELLTLSEALVVAKVRWQIESLFKLWKSHGQLDKVHS